MKVKGDSVIFETVPARVVVRNELSKDGHRYFSFLSEEGCEYMKDYLEERMRDGENLKKESPILTPKAAKKPFISTTKISQAVRIAMRSAGFKWRPYVLRSYFDTQLMLSESKGYVLRDYRTFWMGHVGDIEHRYTTNKGRLPTQVIEDMREAYGKSQEFLQTKVPLGPREEDLKRMFRAELLRMAGYDDEEMEKKGLLELTEDEFRDTVRGRLLDTNPSNNCKQKAISIEDIEAYLEGGWEFVTTLPNNRVVVKLPG
jgi:hypothetical protein